MNRPDRTDWPGSNPDGHGSAGSAGAEAREDRPAADAGDRAGARAGARAADPTADPAANPTANPTADPTADRAIDRTVERAGAADVRPPALAPASHLRLERAAGSAASRSWRSGTGHVAGELRERGGSARAAVAPSHDPGHRRAADTLLAQVVALQNAPLGVAAIAARLLDPLVPGWAAAAALDLVDGPDVRRRIAERTRETRVHAAGELVVASRDLTLEALRTGEPALGAHGERGASSRAPADLPPAARGRPGHEYGGAPGGARGDARGDARGVDLVLPLVLRGRVVALLSLGGLRPDGAALASEADDRRRRTTLDVLAHYARLAAPLLQLARLDEEVHARGARSRGLQAALVALSGARTVEEIGEIVVRDAATALGAHAAALALVTDGDAPPADLTVATAAGYREPEFALLRRLTTRRPLPLTDAARLGQAVYLPSPRALADRYPHLAGQRSEGGWGAADRSWCAVPLPDRLGALLLHFPDERDFDEAMGGELDALVRQAGHAIQRARQAISRHSAHLVARAAERRLRLLADTGAELAGTAEVEPMLQRVAALVTGAMADWCVVTLFDADGAVRRAAASTSPHLPDAASRRLLDDLLLADDADPAARAGQGGPDADDPAAGLGALLRSGRAEVIPVVDDADFARLAPDAAQLEALRALGLTSCLWVPLTAHGRTSGALLLASARDSLRYSTADRLMAEELGRRLASALEHARLLGESQQANLAKAEFLAVMSHELRTPLTAILGYAELLADGFAGPVTPVQHRQLTAIGASGAHLVSLIDEILSFVGMEAGWDRVQPRPVAPARLAHDAVAQLRGLAGPKGLAIELELPRPLPELQLDEGKMRRLLVNLLSNAVKFTERGTVTLAVDWRDDHLTCTVRDTGVGIASEHRARIFEPFWQVERATTRRVGGVGLGLSVARRIATLLGGTVQVESTPGEGSAFTARIPARRA